MDRIGHLVIVPFTPTDLGFPCITSYVVVLHCRVLTTHAHDHDRVCACVRVDCAWQVRSAMIQGCTVEATPSIADVYPCQTT